MEAPPSVDSFARVETHAGREVGVVLSLRFSSDEAKGLFSLAAQEGDLITHVAKRLILDATRKESQIARTNLR